MRIVVIVSSFVMFLLSFDVVLLMLIVFVMIVLFILICFIISFVFGLIVLCCIVEVYFCCWMCILVVDFDVFCDL